MISHKGFYWQNYKNKESRSPLTVTMAKHFSANQASQAQAPTWNPSRCGILQLIPHIKYKEILILKK